mmetsp:Transcript_17127/g.28459  ORF Transcript_17127/g.28459 Transcript_17127/m.28459 type:complete len:219 (-) Transcript_17127:157-813(-)
MGQEYGPADGDGGNVAGDALLVDGSHHDSPDKEKGTHGLNEEGASKTETGVDIVGSKIEGRTAWIASSVTKNCNISRSPQDSSTENGSEELSNDIHGSINEGHLSENKESKSNGWVDVPSRNGGDGVSKDSNTDTKCQGNSCQKGVVQIAVKGEKCLRTDGRTATDKHEQDHGNKLRQDGPNLLGKLHYLECRLKTCCFGWQLLMSAIDRYLYSLTMT